MLPEKEFRRRPYMIVVHSVVPNEKADTKKKNWHKQNIKTTEETGERPFKVIETAYFHDNIPKKHESQAQVILDIMNAKTVKNRFTDITDDNVFQYYITKYGTKVQQAIQQFFIKYPEQLAKYAEKVNNEVKLQAESGEFDGIKIPEPISMKDFVKQQDQIGPQITNLIEKKEDE